MRRRGRAQESTEGPDGLRLGYGPSEGDALSESFLWELANPNTLGWYYPATWRPVYRGVLTDEAFYPDAVRSGRERLGE